MKKLLFGLIATVMISVSGFAKNDLNESIDVKKGVNVTNENCNDKFKVKFNLGNVSNLTESELNSMCDNLVSQNFDLNNEVDECTVSFTAEVNVGFGSVSVTVSYTASNCEIAMNKAKAALKKAVKELQAAF